MATNDNNIKGKTTQFWVQTCSHPHNLEKRPLWDTNCKKWLTIYEQAFTNKSPTERIKYLNKFATHAKPDEKLRVLDDTWGATLLSSLFYVTKKECQYWQDKTYQPGNGFITTNDDVPTQWVPLIASILDYKLTGYLSDFYTNKKVDFSVDDKPKKIKLLRMFKILIDFEIARRWVEGDMCKTLPIVRCQIVSHE